jgi:hypothetical protein
MKLSLPFDLLPHLEGTSITACFGLKNRPPENHTVVELKAKDLRDLLALLQALAADLDSRCQKWRKHHSRSPIPASRRSGLEQSRQIVRRTVELIEKALPD